MGKIKPVFDDSNVVPLNPGAIAYHKALEATEDDLYLIFCLDVWEEPVVATKAALILFKLKIGAIPYLATPIDAIVAAANFETVLVVEEVRELFAKK